MKPLTGYAKIRTRGKSGRNINSSIIMIAKAKETDIKI